MPLPMLFIGIGVAAATGAVGVGKTVKAGIDTVNANSINKSANEIVEDATKLLNAQRLACGNSLLARLDSYFLPLIYRMEDIVKTEGYDYKVYSDTSKAVIASCASVAVSVKSVLDTPLLTDDGLLTDASENTVSNIEGFLKNMRIPY